MALSNVQARYQNALLYDPGMGVGRYPGPERSASTLPTMLMPNPAPMQFPPASAGGATGYGSGNLLAGLSGDSGNVLSSLASINSGSGNASGLSGLIGPLAGLGLKGLQKLLEPKDGGEKKPEAAPEEELLGGDPKAPAPAAGGSWMDPFISAGSGALGGLGGIFTAQPSAPAGYSQVGVSFGDADPTFGAWQQFGGDGAATATGGGLGDASSAPGSFDGAGGGAGADLAVKAGADAAWGTGGTAIADPAAFSAGGIDINPSNIVGGAVGSWLGGKAADGFGEGDPDDRWMRSVGGTIGGALGSAIPIPFLGTAIGSYLGTLAGSAFEGQPDVPYSYAWGGGNFDWDNPSNGPTFGVSGAGSENGGNASVAGGLGGALDQYLRRRAEAEGYAWNPEKVNQGGFYTGVWGGNNAGSSSSLFYQPYYQQNGNGPVLRDGRDEPDQLFNSFDDLSDYAWGSLIGNNYLAQQGSTASWGDVLGNLNSPQSAFRNTEMAGANSESGDMGRPWTAQVQDRTYDATPYWYGSDTGQFRPQEMQGAEAGFTGVIGVNSDGTENFGFMPGNPYDTPGMRDGRSTSQGVPDAGGN